VIPNAAGCDSLITLDLTINSVSDIGTSVTGITITANNSNASYTWLDCDDNFAAISGATNQSFVPLSNGNYAVELIEFGCVDTSICVSINIVDVIEMQPVIDFLIKPNPSSGQFEIDLGQSFGAVTVLVTSVDGSVIAEQTAFATNSVYLDVKQPAGVYFVQIFADQKSQVIPVVIK
jgi:hypothetical protein